MRNLIGRLRLAENLRCLFAQAFLFGNRRHKVPGKIQGIHRFICSCFFRLREHMPTFCNAAESPHKRCLIGTVWRFPVLCVVFACFLWRAVDSLSFLVAAVPKLFCRLFPSWKGKVWAFLFRCTPFTVFPPPTFKARHQPNKPFCFLCSFSFFLTLLFFLFSFPFPFPFPFLFFPFLPPFFFFFSNPQSSSS